MGLCVFIRNHTTVINKPHTCYIPTTPYGKLYISKTL